MDNNFYFAVYLMGLLIGGTFLVASLYIYMKQKSAASVPNSIVYSGVVLLSLSILSSIKIGDFELHANQISNVQVESQKEINELHIKLKNLEARLGQDAPPIDQLTTAKVPARVPNISERIGAQPQAPRAVPEAEETPRQEAQEAPTQISRKDVFVRILYKRQDAPYEEIKRKLVDEGINAVLVPTDFSELGFFRHFLDRSTIRVKFKPAHKDVGPLISRIVTEATGMETMLEVTDSRSANIGDFDIWLR